MKTSYEDFMVKLIWRLFDNLIYHVFFVKTPDIDTISFSKVSYLTNEPIRL